MVLPPHLIPRPFSFEEKGDEKTFAGGLPFSLREKGRGVEGRTTTKKASQNYPPFYTNPAGLTRRGRGG